MSNGTHSVKLAFYVYIYRFSACDMFLWSQLATKPYTHMNKYIYMCLM